MTKKLTPAEQVAASVRDMTLTDIAAASAWDLAVAKQAVIVYGRILGDISANDVRDVLPQQGRGFIGAAFRALAIQHVLEPTGQYVPSTEPATRGHRIAVYRVNADLLIRAADAARTEKAEAA